MLTNPNLDVVLALEVDTSTVLRVKMVWPLSLMPMLLHQTLIAARMHYALKPTMSTGSAQINIKMIPIRRIFAHSLNQGVVPNLNSYSTLLVKLQTSLFNQVMVLLASTLLRLNAVSQLSNSAIWKDLKSNL